MGNITVWTKQNENVLKELEENGRFIARKEFIKKDLEEHAPLVLEVYSWLAKNSPIVSLKPKDVEYPIWVSTTPETTMSLDKGSVVIELSIDKDLISLVNINKWGTILNYSYIPADANDEKRHQAMLRDYNTSDAQAYMSQFYPEIKRKIISSWSRLFDDSIIIGNENSYGIIWEVKQEWIKQIIR